MSHFSYPIDMVLPCLSLAERVTSDFTAIMDCLKHFAALFQDINNINCGFTKTAVKSPKNTGPSA
jgi:hypothetical protein